MYLVGILKNHGQVKVTNPDPNAFLFSLINKDNKPLKMKCIKPDLAIRCSNYIGPNFGNYDQEIATSLKHTSLVEKETNHKMKGEYPQPEVIPDLTRPNFGDHDDEIAYTK